VSSRLVAAPGASFEASEARVSSLDFMIMLVEELATALQEQPSAKRLEMDSHGSLRSEKALASAPKVLACGARTAVCVHSTRDLFSSSRQEIHRNREANVASKVAPESCITGTLLLPAAVSSESRSLPAVF
jgi:hypothetical protein